MTELDKAKIVREPSSCATDHSNQLGTSWDFTGFVGFNHSKWGIITKGMSAKIGIWDLSWNVLDDLHDLDDSIRGERIIKLMQVTLKFQGPAKTHGDVQDGQWQRYFGRLPGWHITFLLVEGLFSPNSVSTLRGSYGKCKGRGMIRVLPAFFL